MEYSSKAYPLWSYIPGIKGVTRMIPSLRRFDQSGVAKRRMEILSFYDTYGEVATKLAFGADRKLISKWRKKLTCSGGKLVSLVPISTRPINVRVPTTRPEIVAFIKSQREAHFRLGKEKLKIFLDQYCAEKAIKPVSVSTIGNIIKRNHFFYQKNSDRIYHNLARKEPHRAKRLRIRHSPKHSDFGHIVSDTVTVFADEVKRYFYCAVDAKLKFALTLPYSRLNSRNNTDFFHHFISVYPVTVIDWQTDNGAENLKEFDGLLKAKNIPHLFSYPHCPQINSYVERYNRTFQDEFLNPNLHLIHQPEELGSKLAEYLVWYNTQRPHQALGQISPLNYLIEKGGMSQMSLTYTVT